MNPKAFRTSFLYWADFAQSWFPRMCLRTEFLAELAINKTENTFSLQSVSQVLIYTNFPINRVHKFPKVEDTQLVQYSSHLSCPMSKFPKLSKPKLLKAQVTQSTSCPNCQKCKFRASKQNLSHGQEYLWPSNSQKYF